MTTELTKERRTVKAKLLSDLRKKLKRAETDEERKKLEMQIQKTEAPYAKYIRPYTQKIIEDRIIPHLEREEQQSVKFAAAVHKLVVFYLDRKNIP